jgi:hypothetical protein
MRQAAVVVEITLTGGGPVEFFVTGPNEHAPPSWNLGKVALSAVCTN